MEPFVGQIMLLGANFAPVGFAFCDGSLLPVDQFQVLFALIGTTYGGDGVNSFGLPDLRSRVPVHQGTGPGLGTYVMGESGGVETVTLLSSQMPTHNHLLRAKNAGETDDPLVHYFGTVPAQSDTSNLSPMAPGSLSPSGGGQPHPNIQTYQAINYVIALQGVFPRQP
jgi:microcystin-dependent protein